MLCDDIRSVAMALNAHKDDVDENDTITWKILHNAASNLHALADQVLAVETHFVPASESKDRVRANKGVMQ